MIVTPACVTKWRNPLWDQTNHLLDTPSAKKAGPQTLEFTELNPHILDHEPTTTATKAKGAGKGKKITITEADVEVKVETGRERER
jgi:hypothetical protein